MNEPNHGFPNNTDDFSGISPNTIRFFHPTATPGRGRQVSADSNKQIIKGFLILNWGGAVWTGRCSAFDARQIWEVDPVVGSLPGRAGVQGESGYYWRERYADSILRFQTKPLRGGPGCGRRFDCRVRRGE